MPRLTRSLARFGTPGFEAVLKEELTALGPDVLGLQQELTAGSTALLDNLGVMILRRTETSGTIQLRAGIFFSSILGGCACAGDPSQENENTEYCEIDITIDRRNGEARVLPARD
ncbi:hypothetical protein [Thioalkalivibrio sp.]|uniref:hypothetical protein n=1 Tax=Thioalkalivibrio sp. TaxID=2093813 RepID=UPI0012D70232|nr:hypothetical protein [Thioalkalivibrio sp.]TVP76525.1 MAG: hypothetical protein EA346_14270 [Thioalkalivibrio sp.]